MQRLGCGGDFQIAQYPAEMMADCFECEVQIELVKFMGVTVGTSGGLVWTSMTLE